MTSELMHLKILLPSQVFAEKTRVSSIVADTREGSFALLPHRLDCVAALVPSILTYEIEGQGKIYLAVDEGVLVKTGLDVTISVRDAVGGADLGKLQELVEKDFLVLNAQELKVREISAKLESNLIRRLAELS